MPVSFLATLLKRLFLLMQMLIEYYVVIVLENSTRLFSSVILILLSLLVSKYLPVTCELLFVPFPYCSSFCYQLHN